MDNEKDNIIEMPETEQKAPAGEPEENVVSVWYGSGNTKWFRRRHFEG